MQARQILSRKQSTRDDLHARPLVFDLKKPHLMFDGARHLCAIAHDAAANQSPTYLRCNRLLLSGIAHKTLGRMLLEASHTNYLKPSATIPPGSLVLSDTKLSVSGASEIAKAKANFLLMRVSRDLPSAPPVMPYPMHPWTQPEVVQSQRAAQRSRQARDALVFFAGCQKRRYGDAWMQEQFQILSRLDVLNTVKKSFSVDVVESPLNFHAREDQSQPPKQIRILDSAENSIPAAHWLPALANSHFFLCAPGGRQPLCHNLIEAMSVGTIPILEYADRIHPPLTDGLNAICFQGRSGLIEVIERVQTMSDIELSQLRENVISFYDQHLCGVRFWGQLLADPNPGDELAMPFHEKNLS